MPEYEFENAKGKRRAVYMPVSEAPRCGDWLDMDGEQWQRVPSVPLCSVEANVMIESMSAPVNDPDVKKAGGTYNEHGEAVFTTKRSRDNYAAMKGITYG